MVKSGETGGSLDDTLLRLAAMLEREVHLRGKIKSAMTYPIAVVGLVTLIMSAMLLFVVPQFQSIYGQLGGTLPLPTRVLLTISQHLQAMVVHRPGGRVPRPVPAEAVQANRRRAARSSIPSSSGSRSSASLFHKTCLSRFSSTLAMLLKSGVPILQALDIVIDTVNNRVVGKAVEDIQSSVREGESIARPLARHEVFPPMVVQMIAVGEETGQVDVMLEKVAQFYDQEVEASVDALTSLIEPILIAFIGACVGAAVIALYMPMFQIINLVK